MSRIESPDTQLVELLRRSDAPAEEDMRRVRESLTLRLALGAAASTALLTSSQSSWAARLGLVGSWSKGVLLAGSLASAAAGAVWYTSTSGQHPSSASERGTLATESIQAKGSATQILPPESSSTLQTSVRAKDPQPAEADEEKPRQQVGKTPTRGGPNTLEAELQLLGKAQNALKTGQPNDALRALDEHARKFPSGVLAAERAGVRPIALCQAGRLDEGRAAARSYLRVVPNSVLSKRIRVACQLPGE